MLNQLNRRETERFEIPAGNSRGSARKLPTPLGTCRYDADVSEHVHVRMRDTSEIMDVPHELSQALLRALPRELLAEVETRLGVRVEGINLQFLAGRPTP